MKKILIATLLFFAVIYLLLNSYFQDVLINKYPTVASVKEAKAIEHGWVPGIIPPSAYDIEEVHDLDKNQLFGRFSYKEQDEAALLKALSPAPDMNNTYQWEAFLFKIDREQNRVKYRNKPNDK